MDDSYRTIGEVSPVYADLGPTRPSTCGSEPSRRKTPPTPPAIQRIISELGLRYRPNDRTDLEAHAARLALLAADLADVPARFLELAAKDWARRNPYLPKASELVALAKAYVDRTQAPSSKDMDIEKRRRMLPRMNQTRTRDDVEWIVDATGNFVLRSI